MLLACIENYHEIAFIESPENNVVQLNTFCDIVRVYRGDKEVKYANTPQLSNAIPEV